MSTESSSSCEKEFVVFYEKELKEHRAGELYIFYVQWTGNEAELTKLASFISKAEYDYTDNTYDHCFVDLDICVKLPESHVDLQCKLHHKMITKRKLFTKLTGKFTCTFDLDEDPKLDDYETIACVLDENFHKRQIVRMFENR